jgi:hypothetical protein
MYSSPLSLLLLTLATGAAAGVNDVLPRMDLGMELEMREEFAVFPRAGETNFQVCFCGVFLYVRWERGEQRGWGVGERNDGRGDRRGWTREERKREEGMG